MLDPRWAGQWWLIAVGVAGDDDLQHGYTLSEIILGELIPHITPMRMSTQATLARRGLLHAFDGFRRAKMERALAHWPEREDLPSLDELLVDDAAIQAEGLMHRSRPLDASRLLFGVRDMPSRALH